MTDNATKKESSSLDDYVLEDQVGHLLRRAHQRATAIFQQTVTDGLTPQQYAALVKIGDFGTVSQNRLGRAVAMDPATSQGVTRRLLAKKLIRRMADTGDRRRTLLSLTPEGESLVARLIPLGARVTEKTLRPLDPAERAAFLALLRKLA